MQKMEEMHLQFHMLRFLGAPNLPSEPLIAQNSLVLFARFMFASKKYDCKQMYVMCVRVCVCDMCDMCACVFVVRSHIR